MIRSKPTISQWVRDAAGRCREARKTEMLVDGGLFAMHILHSGTYYFADGVLKNPVSGVGSLPLSRVLPAARREERCQSAYLPTCLAA